MQSSRSSARDYARAYLMTTDDDSADEKQAMPQPRKRQKAVSGKLSGDPGDCI